MSHDLLIHAVVDKTGRACILSRRFVNDRNEEEALNQLVISFEESHNSASYLPFTPPITMLKQQKKRKINLSHVSLFEFVAQLIVVG